MVTKGMNIPSDFFEGTDEEITNRFREYREGDKAILSFDRLTVTDDWAVFVPSLLRDPCVVYYNRRSDMMRRAERFTSWSMP